MIYIEQETSNEIVLTLSELSKTDSIGFIFEFIYEAVIDANPIYFIAPNQSTSSLYDSFILVESGTGSKTGGINIPLNLKFGQYEYRVYDYFEPITDIEDVVINEDDIVEIGLMQVVGEEPTKDSIFD